MAPHFAYYYRLSKCLVLSAELRILNFISEIKLLIFKRIYKCILHNFTFVQIILCSFLSTAYFIYQFPKIDIEHILTIEIVM